ncbi:hypothetical protein MOF8_23575 [Methylobacterium oryzae]
MTSHRPTMPRPLTAAPRMLETTILVARVAAPAAWDAGAAMARAAAAPAAPRRARRAGPFPCAPPSDPGARRIFRIRTDYRTAAHVNIPTCQGWKHSQVRRLSPLWACRATRGRQRATALRAGREGPPPRPARTST